MLWEDAMGDFSKDLLRLYDGSIQFEEFVKLNKKYVFTIVNNLYSMYKAKVRYSLDVEDLLQEALLEVWRAVDLWIEEKGKALSSYVIARIKTRIDNCIKKSLGWPRKDRPPVAIRAFSYETASEDGYLPFNLYVTDKALSFDVLNINKVLCKVPDGINKDVFIGVYNGLDSETISKMMYADDDRRRCYEFRSSGEALKGVKKSVKRINRKVKTVKSTLQFGEEIDLSKLLMFRSAER
jgi:DNA-directed RNA polymerase specialized sigma24 family protein